MARERRPDAPYEPEHLVDPARADLAANEMRPQSDFDNGVQADPPLGPFSSAKVVLTALALAVVLGGIFYGLNSSRLHQQASTVPTPATTQSSPAIPPPAVPQPNTAPGTTTGAAPAK